MGKMRQNYNLDLFLPKLPPEMVPSDPPAACHIHKQTIRAVLESVNRMSEVHY